MSSFNKNLALHPKSWGCFSWSCSPWRVSCPSLGSFFKPSPLSSCDSVEVRDHALAAFDSVSALRARVSHATEHQLRMNKHQAAGFPSNSLQHNARNMKLIALNKERFPLNRFAPDFHKKMPAFRIIIQEESDFQKHKPRPSPRVRISLDEDFVSFFGRFVGQEKAPRRPIRRLVVPCLCPLVTCWKSS